MTRSTLLYYSEDAGDVYGFWQWVDGRRGEPHGFRIPRTAIEPLAAELRAGLPGRLDGETQRAAIERMLTAGALTSRAREASLSQRLGALLLPEQLIAEILQEEQPPLLRMLPAPSCAVFPWESMLIDASPARRRLIDLVDIVSDPPAGVHAGRARVPVRRQGLAPGPAVHIVDAEPRGAGLGRILTDAQRDALLAANADTRTRTPQVTRADLSTWLRTAPAPRRLLYVGHVVSPDAHAGATSLLLSDDADMYGVLPAVRGTRPLSALDLLEGTLFAEYRLHADPEAMHDPLALTWPTGRREALSGPDIWPMPPRVALLACDSGGDLARVEPFGLAIACINAGAEVVTATRWTLPTDRAFRSRPEFRPALDPQPLFDMVTAVDQAHDGTDPVPSIAAWQRQRAAEWDAEGPEAPAWLSPVTWAALVTYAAPAKAVIPLTRDEVAQLAAENADAE